MATPVTMPISTAKGAMDQWPRPSPRSCGSHCVCAMAITPEQTASSDPTARSMWRVTMMKTIPVAMIATDTIWTARL